MPYKGVSIPQKTLFHPLVLLEWESCASLPTIQRMQDVQAVVLNNKVYVSAAKILDQSGMHGFKSNFVCIYDVSGNSWKEIRSATSQHALAVYSNQLVLIGGCDHTSNTLTNELWVFQEEWSQPIPHTLPPMPTKRCNASAVGIGSHLAVAGGNKPSSFRILPSDVFDTVEIYDGQEWKAAEPLPKPSFCMNSVLQGDTWYLMGGKGQGRAVYYVSLNDLIRTTNAENTTSVWKKLPDVPFENSTPAVFMNELISIGGKNSDLPPQFSVLRSLQQTQLTSKIHAYSTSTHSWVHVGDTLAAYCSICATTLPSGELFMLGDVNYPHRTSIGLARCEHVLKGSAKGKP